MIFWKIKFLRKQYGDENVLPNRHDSEQEGTMALISLGSLAAAIFLGFSEK